MSIEPEIATTKKPGLGAIFLTVFLDLLGFGLVLPFLAEEARDTFHTTEFVGALLAAAYSAMQFLFVPVWGRLSDRIGRRPVLLWSVLAAALGMFGLAGGLALGGSVFWLFAARIWSGIATANLGTASAYIADVTKPEDRAKGMGLFGVAFGLGFILGPGIGGMLSEITVNGRSGVVACALAGVLGLVNFAWTLFGLRESLPPELRSKSKRRLTPLDWNATLRTLSRPSLGLAVLVNFMTIASFTILDQTFRFFTKDLFGMTQRGTGLVLAVVGITAALVQGGLVRQLSKRVSELLLLRVGLVVQVAAFACLAAAPELGLFGLWTGSVLLALGNGLSQPSGSAYLSKRAGVSEQGEVLGTNQSFASLARMFGPAIGGYLYGAFGLRWPYAASAIGMTVAVALALSLRDTSEPAAPTAALP